MPRFFGPDGEGLGPAMARFRFKRSGADAGDKASDAQIIAARDKASGGKKPGKFAKDGAVAQPHTPRAAQQEPSRDGEPKKAQRNDSAHTGGVPEPTSQEPATTGGNDGGDGKGGKPTQNGEDGENGRGDEQARDIKNAIANGLRMDVEDYGGNGQLSVGILTFAQHCTAIKDDRDSIVINGNNVSVPSDLVVGSVMFRPHGLNDLEGHEEKRAGNVIAFIEGCTAFADELDSREAQGQVIPAILIGKTNERMAKFVKRLGFYSEEPDENGKIMVVVSTDTFRQRIRNLPAPDSEVMRRLARMAEEEVDYMPPKKSSNHPQEGNTGVPREDLPHSDTAAGPEKTVFDQFAKETDGSEDPIEAQQRKLDEIHFAQMDIFQEKGLLDKARAALGAEDNANIGQPMASVVIKNTNGKDTITEYSIALAQTRENANGHEQTTFRYIPVAQEFAGVVTTIGAFDNEDAEVVMGMIQRLQGMKEEGTLPHLEPNCLSISNPHTAIVMVPREPEIGSEIKDVTVDAKRGIDVISGIDSGFIRSDPEKVKDLLLQSLTDGGVVTGQEEEVAAVLGRVIDLSVNFGNLVVGSEKSRQGIIDHYRSVTSIARDSRTNQNLTIRIEGPLNTLDLPSDAEVMQTPFGTILPKPRVKISFTDHRDDDVIITHSFDFGRNGTTRFEQSVDGAEFTVIQLTQEQALAYLTQHLPTIVDNNGHKEPSQGSMYFDEGNWHRFFNEIRVNRLRTEDTQLQQAIQRKQMSHGFESVMYLPTEYFFERHRHGEFFSVNHPESFFPYDVLDRPEPEERFDSIARTLGKEVDAQTREDIITLSKGIPAGMAHINVLVANEDGTSLPQLKHVPTNIFDKAAAYFLEHPDLVKEPLAQYKALFEAMGRNLPITSITMEYGVMPGLLDADNDRAKKVFGIFATTGYTGEDPAVDDAINRTYDSLVQLGRRLGREIYSKDEISRIAYEIGYTTDEGKSSARSREDVHAEIIDVPQTWETATQFMEPQSVRVIDTGELDAVKQEFRDAVVERMLTHPAYKLSVNVYNAIYSEESASFRLDLDADHAIEFGFGKRKFGDKKDIAASEGVDFLLVQHIDTSLPPTVFPDGKEIYTRQTHIYTQNEAGEIIRRDFGNIAEEMRRLLQGNAISAEHLYHREGTIFEAIDLLQALGQSEAYVVNLDENNQFEASMGMNNLPIRMEELRGVLALADKARFVDVNTNSAQKEQRRQGDEVQGEIVLGDSAGPADAAGAKPPEDPPDVGIGLPNGEEQPSPQEIHERSLDKVHALLAELSIEPNAQKSVLHTAISSLAEIDALKGDGEKVRIWAQRLEALEIENDTQTTELYFAAARLGDKVAFNRLSDLLQREKKETVSKRDQMITEDRRFSYVLESPMLDMIIRNCAREGIPADAWLRFSIDNNQKNKLKMIYYYQSRDAGEEAKSSGIRYREEVTTDFLQENVMTDEFAWSEASVIFAAQESNEKRAEIFRQMQRLSENVPLDLNSFSEFVSFSGRVLSVPNAGEFADIAWMQTIFGRCREILLDQGYDAYTVYQHSDGVELDFARFNGASPSELITKIDEMTSRRLQLDIPEEQEGFANIGRNKDFVVDLRNTFLETFAQDYAALGDFTKARIFLNELPPGSTKAYIAMECLKYAKTSGEAAMLKPDQMELEYDGLMGEVFKVKEAIFARDYDTLQTLAKSYAQQNAKKENVVISKLLDECVRATYNHDEEKGRALAEEAYEILEGNGVKYASIWRVTMETDDSKKLQLNYTKAQRTADPAQQLEFYTQLALESAKLIFDERD